ncbi:disease resistance protein RPV1-like isoform X1 [Cucumis melo]|uniref:Disease resistance protein RPV1-like isoform X1 n=1 Tax=Cucumis melo TaxID=3656 RepID=A0A1S3C005_CUCME|nr:disease resistance protein RPV1-like isoform X1 [Cucumis melo]
MFYKNIYRFKNSGTSFDYPSTFPFLSGSLICPSNYLINMNLASGSSSSSRFRCSFDVFLSFRGEDTRSNFTSHLNMALRQRGINVFIDDKLSRGEEISASLLEAIEESKISIVIISENYASSSWCLNELEKIIMCNKLRWGVQLVLPIFYKVDPSQVRKQSGRFGEEFGKLEVRFSSDKMEAWREAMISVSHMSGWPILQNDDEANLIQEIVQEVLKKLNRGTMLLRLPKYPVGIDRQVNNILLQVMSADEKITMVGIYGIGGIGKTTLAKALYNRIADDFEGCCFLAKIREASNQYDGLVQLQKKLLCEILMDNSINVSNLDIGINIIRNRLCSKKILLILDDVDTREQLEVLAGGHDWFGPGSMVIATTRDKHLLAIHQFNILQSVQGLNDGYEALELFSWHAFKRSCPSSDYLDLSKRAVRYCLGLPLALEVVGSFLFSIKQSKFKLILDEYENQYLDKGIQDPLRISYDGLENEVKEIFLYISCCFVREDIYEVKTKLEACGCLCLEKGTTKLMNLSLLTIDEHSNQIEMHDLIQQMGRTIHLSETSKSHKRKRLLIKDDVMDVLNGNKEARAVKVIKLNFPKPTELEIDSRAFEKVKKLVVLDIRNATSSRSSDLEYVPSSLRWMNWPHFPFSSLPSTYTMDNLMELKLPYSSIKHFGKAFMCGGCLKKINFRGSKFLVEIPDLSIAINLEELDLLGCVNLVKIHESVGSLSKLVEFYLSSNIKGFEQFPSYLKLKSLKTLFLYRCRIDEWCPQFSEEMDSLEVLLIYNSTVINQLSPTIGYLTSLKKLWIIKCKELKTLPSTIYRLSNLTCLRVLGYNFSTFPSLNDPSSPFLFPYLTSIELFDCKITNLDFLETMVHVAPFLKELDLSRNNFCKLPSCITSFKSLIYLSTSFCKLLEEIPKVPKGVLYMNATESASLARFPDNILDFISCYDNYAKRRYNPNVIKELRLMNCDIPDWCQYKSTNNSITFLLPANHPTWERKVSIASCVKLQGIDKAFKVNSRVFINDFDVHLGQFWKHEFEGGKGPRGEYLWIEVLDPYRLLYIYDHYEQNQPCFRIKSSRIIFDRITVLFEVITPNAVSIKKCGVHVIMEE